MENTNKVQDDSEDMMKVYLQPKKDPHVRIGRSYQAAIPENKVLPETNSDKSIPEGIDSKPYKKQKIEDN